jgi:hypothetical protein
MNKDNHIFEEPEVIYNDPRIGISLKHLRNCGRVGRLVEIKRYKNGREVFLTERTYKDGGSSICTDDANQFRSV